MKLPEFIALWTAPFHVSMDGIKDARGSWICTAKNPRLANQLVELMNFAAAIKTDKIVVVLDGGMVESVVGTGVMIGKEVQIIDYDTDGSDEDELTEIGQSNGVNTVPAYFRTEIVEEMTIILPTQEST